MDEENNRRSDRQSAEVCLGRACVSLKKGVLFCNLPLHANEIYINRDRCGGQCGTPSDGRDFIQDPNPKL